MFLKNLGVQPCLDKWQHNHILGKLSSKPFQVEWHPCPKQKQEVDLGERQRNVAEQNSKRDSEKIEMMKNRSAWYHF
jgi:hypothetical protein